MPKGMLTVRWGPAWKLLCDTIDVQTHDLACIGVEPVLETILPGCVFRSLDEDQLATGAMAGPITYAQNSEFNRAVSVRIRLRCERVDWTCLHACAHELSNCAHACAQIGSVSL